MTAAPSVDLFGPHRVSIDWSLSGADSGDVLIESMPAPATRSGAAAQLAAEVWQMPTGEFTFQAVSGVPVVAAPEEIDITNAPMLRSARAAMDELIQDQRTVPR